VSSRYELMQPSVRWLKAGQVRKRMGQQVMGRERGDGKMRLYRLCLCHLLLIIIWNILLQQGTFVVKLSFVASL